MKLPVRMREEARELKNTLMALPFAKAEDIRGIFDEIDEGISLALRQRCNQFLQYFKRTWLSENGQNFRPEDFSVFGHADRTNNDVESFHSRLHLISPTIWAFLSKCCMFSIPLPPPPVSQMTGFVLNMFLKICLFFLFFQTNYFP